MGSHNLESAMPECRSTNTGPLPRESSAQSLSDPTRTIICMVPTIVMGGDAGRRRSDGRIASFRTQLAMPRPTVATVVADLRSGLRQRTLLSGVAAVVASRLGGQA